MSNFLSKLEIAIRELAYQKKEKQKRAAELIIANQELLFQNSEKEKRAAELLLANQELAYQNAEKEKRAAELLIANEELLFQNREKEKRADELFLANQELIRQKESLNEYMLGLKQMMFVISHKVRQPVANILGLSSQFTQSCNSSSEMEKLVGHIEQSALSLDVFTKELTILIGSIEQKV